MVLALAPLGFHHPISDVQATSSIVTIPFKTSVDDATPHPSRAPDAETRLHTSSFNIAARMGALDWSPASTDAGPSRENLVRFAWPTQGTVTQTFFEWHPGIDIANEVGTPEVAADAGTVVFAGWGSYGIYVEIDHGNGFQTIYGHMSTVMVKTGQAVEQGQQIGLMGATGRASGPHLHFEIRYQGVPQNPADLLS
jgi:murein DD-endopeptidase MepM/ murein hydrolase activator NlpD